MPFLGVDSSPPLLSGVVVALFRAIEHFYVAAANQQAYYSCRIHDVGACIVAWP